MGRIATQQAADAEDRVILFGFGESASSQGNLKGSGNTNQHNVFLLRPRAQKTIVGALPETLGDKSVEARDDNRKPLAGSAEAALDRRNRWLGGTFEFYFLFRISSLSFSRELPRPLYLTGESP
jgi:hypothetical protein